MTTTVRGLVVTVMAAALCAAAAAVPAAEAPRKIRVSVMPITSAVEWQASGPRGIVVDIWSELTRRLGLESEYAKVDSFTALLESVQDSSADVALGPMAITEARERAIDLTHPIFNSGMRIAVRARQESGLFDAIGALFSWSLLELVAAVLGLAVVSAHLLWWLERRRNPQSFPADYPDGIRESAWWILSTIVTGGCDDKHVDSVPGRAIAVCWMIGGMVLIAAFTSMLTATMTADRVAGAIHAPRDLYGRVVGCQQAAVSGASVQQRGGIVKEFATIRDALDALSMGMVEAVVAEGQSLMLTVNEHYRGRLRLVPGAFDNFDYGFGLQGGSPLREALNTTILKMREDGTMDRLREQWLGRHD